jgi:hypothetical protein
VQRPDARVWDGGAKRDVVEVGGADQSGGARVARVEIANASRGVDIGSGLPAVVFVAVSLPLDEILELVSEDTAIEDALDFIMFVFAD